MEHQPNHPGCGRVEQRHATAHGPSWLIQKEHDPTSCGQMFHVEHLPGDKGFWPEIVPTEKKADGGPSALRGAALSG